MREQTERAALSPESQVLFDAVHQAFIKRIVLNGAVCYGVHTPDGRMIGVAPDRETAFAAARQHDLEPVSAH